MQWRHRNIRPTVVLKWGKQRIHYGVVASAFNRASSTDHRANDVSSNARQGAIAVKVGVIRCGRILSDDRIGNRNAATGLNMQATCVRSSVAADGCMVE